MKAPRETLVSIAVLSCVLLVNAFALWSETSISRVDLNDNVFHYTLIERIVQAVQFAPAAAHKDTVEIQYRIVGCDE